MRGPIEIVLGVGFVLAALWWFYCSGNLFNL